MPWVNRAVLIGAARVEEAALRYESQVTEQCPALSLIEPNAG